MLVQALADAGVNTIFALSGNQIMSVFDACIDADMEIVHTRHEGAAVYMAEAYAQLTGNIGVVLVTAGAGLGNAVGALFSASESDTPVLLISGDSPVAQDGKGAFQEFDQVSVTKAVTRWSCRVTAVDSLVANLSDAFQIAQTPHPGPVHLAVPVDVLKQQQEVAVPQLYVHRSGANDADIQIIQSALSGAEKPLIITGPSLNRTRQPDLAEQLHRKLRAPIIPMESPRGLNDPSLGNFKSIVGEADVIVTLGKRIDFTISFGNAFSATWFGVFATKPLAEQASHNLDSQLQLAAVADPIEFARQLILHSGTVADPKSEWRGRVEQSLRQRVHAQSGGRGLSPTELCSVVQTAVDQSEDPVLICDGGEFGQWAQACLTAPRRVINGMSGSIGSGIGYGIGAAKVNDTVTVFVMSGDGSLGFHLAEIETAVRNNLSLVIIVGNDSCWNAEHQLQINEFGDGRLYACKLSDISYHEACMALGGAGYQVSTIEELQSVLSGELQSNVLCIDVRLDGLPAPVF